MPRREWYSRICYLQARSSWRDQRRQWIATPLSVRDVMAVSSVLGCKEESHCYQTLNSCRQSLGSCLWNARVQGFEWLEIYHEAHPTRPSALLSQNQRSWLLEHHFDTHIPPWRYERLVHLRILLHKSDHLRCRSHRRYIYDLQFLWQELGSLFLVLAFLYYFNLQLFFPLYHDLSI